MASYDIHAASRACGQEAVQPLSEHMRVYPQGFQYKGRALGSLSTVAQNCFSCMQGEWSAAGTRAVRYRQP